ncbi:hypothetical protein AWJ20_601 [Sugiyamaella lignohabitans]|uniref:Uncharacterized protein n=1 Tax=Sugiyamaella lignohabitans TaxID=796027 RepID=A0A167D149_9ASCO|nr:uncharacterized protein AWJ20_601 [Sugiyamaella lignohabitans]ANB12351.1 hypothetical protein AWJ20_601 [Sugiyamaella lignohabitans]
MYGKSRLIKDLASHHVYLSYMCLRKNDNSGYPGPRFSYSIDSGTTQGYLYSEDEGFFAEHVLLFLICTLQVITRGLECNDDNYMKVEEFWDFQERSSAFYQTVEMCFGDKQDSKSGIWQTITSKGAVIITQDTLCLSQKVQQLLRSEWDKYCSALKKSKDMNIENYFVLAIDEAEILNLKNSQKIMSFSHFQVFKRVAHCLVANNLWKGFAIVLASRSGLRDYDVSLSDSGLIDVVTWYDLDTFDYHVRWGERPLTLDFAEIGTLRFYAKFGRPIWKLYIDSKLENKLLADASAKLRGRHADGLSKHHTLFVIYAPVMNLDFCTAENLVESRMATVLSVSYQRDILKVGYLSEPILVMAAHRLLQEENDLDLISLLLRENVMSPGEASELIARWMLLDVLKSVGLRNGLQSNYCRVRDLFNGLEKKYLVTCNWEHPNQHQLFNERIHINHWMTLESECTIQMLALGFLRGCGFCFERRDRDFDLIIPIYLESRNVDLTNIRFFERGEDSKWGLAELDSVSQAFSVILIHVTNTENSHEGHNTAIHDRMVDAEQLIFGRYKPFISLHMKLGAEPPTGYDQTPTYIENVFANQEDSADIYLHEREAASAQGFNLAYDLRVTGNKTSNSDFIDRLQQVVHLAEEDSEDPSGNVTLQKYSRGAYLKQMEVIEEARKRKHHQRGAKESSGNVELLENERALNLLADDEVGGERENVEGHDVCLQQQDVIDDQRHEAQVLEVLSVERQLHPRPANELSDKFSSPDESGVSSVPENSGSKGPTDGGNPLERRATPVKRRRRR